MASSLDVIEKVTVSRAVTSPAEALHAPSAFATRYPDIADMLPFPLFLPKELESDTASLSLPTRAVLQHTLDWLDAFIIREDNRLGRPGAVCPFVKPALQQQRLYAAMCPTGPHPTPAQLCQLVRPYRLALQALSHPPSPIGMLSSIMLVLPAIAPQQEAAILETTHRMLKTELLSVGILAGQFYPSCPVGSTWNPAFPVLQSPFPMLVLRNLIESDWRFVREVPEWQDAYHRWFAHHASGIEPFTDLQPDFQTHQ